MATTALAQREPEPEPSGLALVVQRLAENPTVDVAKLREIVELQERITSHQSRDAFNAAMSLAQAEMGRVAADAVNPQTHSRYASYGALDRALRPIYTKHGFGLSFNTDADAPADYVRVLCEVTHRDGYAKSYHIDMPADGKGAKGGDVMTKTHAVGAAASYGMRYLLKMIFNVAVGEDDDDGNGATAQAKPKAPVPVPDGFDDWATDMAAVADEGAAKFHATWNASPEVLRKYAIANHRAMLTDWERRYKAADKGAPRG
jgi:hypothetical protein